MDYSNLIHDFVDGSLEPEKEAELFNAIAGNDNLRSELKQFIEFERAARFDTGAYVPSAASTANIFSKLGIEQTAAATAAGSSVGWLPYLSNIITGVVTAILTASVMYYSIEDFTAPSTPVNEVFAEKQINNGQKNIFVEESIPITRASEEKPKVIERVIVKYVPVPMNTSSAVSSNTLADSQIGGAKEMQSFESLISQSEIQPSSQSEFAEFARTDNSFERIYNSGTTNFDDIYSSVTPLDLSVEVTGSDYWLFPAADVAKPESDFFENKNISLLYPVTNKVHLGAEFRQEAFYHIYRGFEGVQEYEYRQHNNYYSLSILGRWLPFEYGFFNPFIQGAIGTNIADLKMVGPVGRMMFGAEFNPSEDYAFVIGLEGSVLYFNHDGTYQPTSKIGLHYGLRFNF